MINIATGLLDQPLRKSRYRSTHTSDQPLVLLGFKVKNRYDESRLRFKKFLNPIGVKHTGAEQPIYMHGVALQPPRDLINRLCTTLARAIPINASSYHNILRYNHMSCDTCVQHLDHGLYPVDVTCLSRLSNNRFRSDYMYLRSLLDPDPDLPWFCSWTNFNIFIISAGFNQHEDHK